MNVDKRGGRREKRRAQFGLRTLLVSAMILGPLSGWYGPWIVTQLRDLMANDPKAQPAPPSPQRLQMAKLQARLQQLQQRRQQLRPQRLPRRDVSPLLVNPNGTFNMRYHHDAPVSIEIERGMKADMLQRDRRQGSGLFDEY
jgi:hypothetical protein